MLFKNIDIPEMLYCTNGRYHSINEDGNISIFYKFLLCILWPLQLRFNNYDSFRKRQKIIAQCTWTTGHLTNTLNYLYDSDEKRIYITQERRLNVFDPSINYEATHFDYAIDKVDFNAGDTLTVDQTYIVINGRITYNSEVYEIKDKITVVDGVLTFTTNEDGYVEIYPLISEPSISDPYIVLAIVYIWIPFDVYEEDGITYTLLATQMISDIEQIKITGLTYELKKISSTP